MPTSWVCVDASLLVRACVDPDAEAGRDRLAGWARERTKLAAPALIVYEAVNVLYQYERLSLVSSAAVDLALEAVLAVPLHLHSDALLHRQAMSLARRFSLPAAYDAHYLALAKALSCELWTADQRLVNAVQPDLPWVKLSA